MPIDEEKKSQQQQENLTELRGIKEKILLFKILVIVRVEDYGLGRIGRCGSFGYAVIVVIVVGVRLLLMMMTRFVRM